MSTFQWNKPKKWSGIVRKICTSALGDDFIVRLKKNDITPNLFDDGWLNKLVEQKEITAYTGNFLDFFTTEIKSNWSNIKVFHACRVKDIADYYSKGIVTSSIPELDRLVLQTLKPYVDKKTSTKLINLMHKYYNKSDEKVFVSIDKYHLQLLCCNHIEYGSEYLLSSVLLLEKFGIPIQPILASIKRSTSTIPTIFECDLPNECISPDDLKELSRILLTEGCKMMLSENYYPPSRRTGFGINSIIKPGWLKNHVHPTINTTMKTLPPIWLDVKSTY